MQGQLKTAKIASLAGQISPHFLFNAMNNICSLMDEDVAKAQTALRAFSDVLRFSLNDTVKELVPLKEELGLVDNYMEVVGIQFEDKLIFTTSIPDDVLDYSIPPMFIQLLVENAIKHGISKLKQGGRVDISVVNEREVINIKVTNSGNFREGGDGGVGLFNIRERLKLVYGDSANFRIFEANIIAFDDKNNCCVTADLTIPKQKLYC